MSFAKKIFSALGPFVLAVVILVIILFSPTKIGNTVSSDTLEKAATSMSINVIKGNIIKNEAMQSEKYVPFFGSSELSRIDSFHPSVLAQKYHRNYRPFLLGAAGTQSLSQFSMLSSMGSELKGKKAVFVISPQWFVKKGIKKEMFSLYFSPLQTYQWLLNLKQVDKNASYYAERLLTFSSVNQDTSLKTMMEQVKNGEELTESQKDECALKLNIFSREDDLFGRLGLISKQNEIRKSMKALPTTYNFDKLDMLAYAQGKKLANNNPYELNNSFYSKRIEPIENSLKNSQVDYDYRYSKEFADFQLVLAEFAKLKMDVLFVIPPVNGKWSDYTGLSQEMLDQFATKIKTQLNDQGFNNVADLHQYKDSKYFMNDTIHLGWRGWLTLDKQINPFLSQKAKTTPQYTIKSYYLSKEWQMKNPETLTSNSDN